MLYFLITFGVFLMVILAMSVGYIVHKKKISGSCGGLSTIGVDKACDCDNPCDRKLKAMAEQQEMQTQTIDVIDHASYTTMPNLSLSSHSDLEKNQIDYTYHSFNEFGCSFGLQRL